MKNKLICIVFFVFSCFTFSAKVQGQINAQILGVEVDNKIVQIEDQFLLPKDILVKGYYDQKKRIKSKRANPILYFKSNSSDQFIIANNVKGSEKVQISSLKKEKLFWMPNSNYGYIGQVDFKIKLTPIVPKFSWGFAAYASLPLDLIGVNPESIYNHKFSLNLFQRLKHNGSLIYKLNYYRTLSTDYYIIEDYYVYDLYSNSETFGQGFSIGLGIQSNKRTFSLFATIGIHSLHKTDYEERKYPDRSDNDIITDDFIEPIYSIGVNIKLFDTRFVTCLLPISFDGIYTTDIDKLINFGLELQF